MPFINGLKMACEPCIRGHRSSKCTHASERLMVPVRKPGRPLSACPHARDQPCSCGGVTAAIPRKQSCHCGSSTPLPSSGQATPQDSSSDAPSPTRATFKVQKSTSRPQSSRKPSFGPANLDRMDMNSVNIIPFEQRLQGVPLPYANGYAIPGPPQSDGHAPQYAAMQAQFGHVPLEAQPQVHPGIHGIPNGFGTGIGNILEHAIEGPRAMPTAPAFNTSNAAANGNSGKRPHHNHTVSSASTVSEPEETHVPSCCSSKHATKQESISSHGTPNVTPQMAHEVAPLNQILFDPASLPHHQQHLPQTTVYTYPPTYGSFQNPLQPFTWRQGVNINGHGLPEMPGPLLSGNLPFGAMVIPESLNTLHACSCGDGCQCIGCAAHPYNAPTQNYVRRAWSSMFVEPAPGESYANNHSNGDGPPAPSGGESSSPAAQTPSSSASGNIEEQSLSASDFFFVNYPFSPEDGCGGDTESCPCGDDCQCLGCSIHNQPPIPCEGEKGACPCGDDCECIGCEIHNGTVKV